jgi:cytosine/adenosine deaminase-related metal-dependent hydrolase
LEKAVDRGAQALHLMTLGGAEALGVGSLEPGKETDIVAPDPQAAAR